MLFNSWQFIIFLIVVYGLYLLFNHRWQNRMLLVASCIFYGLWSWKFLFLMMFSTVLEYFFGLGISNAENKKAKKALLFCVITIELLILCFFKYFNFFAVNFEYLLGFFGFKVPSFVLNIVLPIGISFHTFKAMSYCIDIYRKEVKPTSNFIDFSLFISIFPLMIAGPIERAKHLLPQVINKRKLSLSLVREGAYLFFWGMFKKIFIADNVAKIANVIFAKEVGLSGWEVLLGVYAFSFQIYADFSGYSDIARGIGKLMGFDFVLNFNLPYFSTSPRDLWKRWHISLSTWLRDYLYIPLGGNRRGSGRTYFNLMVTMLLGGLWHGASWTFVIWGAYHGVLLSANHLIVESGLFRLSFKRSKNLESIVNFLKIVGMFHLTALGWLFFRAGSFGHVLYMLKSLFLDWHITWPTMYYYKELFLFIWVLLAWQFLQLYWRNLDWFLSVNPKFRWFYAGIVLGNALVVYSVVGKPTSSPFIYFQF